MHGIDFDDFRMDGIPFVTQLPITPGETFTYEFVAKPSGSHMYHSHHNATDQVGRGLLGAFIVDPADPAERYDQKYGVTQEYIFIHNDSLGGFTINGHGFPATDAHRGQEGRARPRPLHERGRDDAPVAHPRLPPARRRARRRAPGHGLVLRDTLGVNPGERYDAIIEADRPGVWAFHCHILPHVEGLDGMFGMVTALVVTE